MGKTTLLNYIRNKKAVSTISTDGIDISTIETKVKTVEKKSVKALIDCLDFGGQVAILWLN